MLFESDEHFRTNRLASSADGVPFKAVNFDVSAASAVALLVNIPRLHGSTFYPIAIGTSKEFVCVCDGSLQGTGDLINIKGSGGTATYSGGVSGG